MSAINPIVQTPTRLNSDAFASNAAQTTAAAAPQGFSNTLSSVAAKPARKSGLVKTPPANARGDALPPSGNPPPPSPAAVTAATAAAAAAAAAAAPSANPTPPPPVSSAQAGDINAAPVAPAAPGGARTAAAEAAQAAATSTTTPVLSPGATPDADAALRGNGDAASAADLADLEDAPAGQVAQLSPAAVQAQAPGAAAAGAEAAAGPAAATTGPSEKATVRTPVTIPSSDIPGRGAASMRAIYPTGNSGATTSGRTAAIAPGQEMLNTPTTDSPAGTPAPAGQVDTPAMINAMQTATVSAASPGSAAPSAPAVNPSDTPPGPVNLLSTGGDVAAAAPALAAAAASAAQVVSTLAAGAAVDKKSHDTQTQIASTSAAASSADAAGAAQLLNGSGPTHAQAIAAPTFKVNAAVDSAEFGQNVASHLSTMVDGNVNSAKLQVSPPALGPIEVRIAIQGDHAQVWMASHSAMTRDALQNAAPQLKEMLNSQGFSQVSVDISQRSFQERTPMAHAYEWNAEPNGTPTAVSSSAAGVAGRSASGMLDAYA